MLIGSDGDSHSINILVSVVMTLSETGGPTGTIKRSNLVNYY